MALAKVQHQIQNELTRTLNPGCTGASVIAMSFDGGVAIAADRQVSHGKTARYQGVSRIFRLNSSTLIAFGGDHADFQYIQNLVDRRQMDYRAELLDFDAELSPKAVHGFLTAMLYYRRCRMNPLWNQLVVVGMQSDENNEKKPFLGTVTLRGVAYQQKFIATGLGAMILQQSLETAFRDCGTDGKSTLTEAEAVALLKTSLQLVYYRDCLAGNAFEIGIVKEEDAKVGGEEKLTGNWDAAEYNGQYE